MKKICAVAALVSPAALAEIALAGIDGGAPPAGPVPGRSNAVTGRPDQAVGQPWNVRDPSAQGTPRSFGDVRNPVRVAEPVQGLPRGQSADFIGFQSGSR